MATLYPQQQEIFNRFDESLQKGESLLLPAPEREEGKTTILNEIGYVYQALGYEILLFSPAIPVEPFCASRYVTVPSNDLKGLLNRTKKYIAIFDGYEKRPEDFHEALEMLQTDSYGVKYLCIGFHDNNYNPQKWIPVFLDIQETTKLFS